MAIKLPLHTLFLLLVLLLSAAWMPPKASAQPRTCSIELDSSGCTAQDCVAKCASQFNGVGECAHQEYVSNFHCVCLYACL
ncbi:defensin-like protein 155 [Syzygium oleosum]|uniref:defensin-like protein 155 n=1 Tax=Syzygium oleosum TaxID=219896 RepID=UPI0011D267F1|nr:defensin-like protein 155 [Syzygium oleosum]